MSIKTFHLVFISVSVLLAGVVAIWAFDYAQQVSHSAGYVATGIGSVFVGLGLMAYEVVFYRKMKEL